MFPWTEAAVMPVSLCFRDDLVDDLTEDECTGLEIARCYEQYLREIGEEEI